MGIFNKTPSAFLYTLTFTHNIGFWNLLSYFEKTLHIVVLSFC